MPRRKEVSDLRQDRLVGAGVAPACPGERKPGERLRPTVWPEIIRQLCVKSRSCVVQRCEKKVVALLLKAEDVSLSLTILFHLHLLGFFAGLAAGELSRIELRDGDGFVAEFGL